MIKNRMILGILLFTIFGLMSAGSNNNFANAVGDKSGGDHDDKRSGGDHDDKRSGGDHDDKRSGDGNCYKKGVSDGKDNPFNSKTHEKCGHDYYKGFIKGCTSVEGNTKDVCESATDQ